MVTPLALAQRPVSQGKQGRSASQGASSIAAMPAVEMRRSMLNTPFELVVVGTSLGGLHALEVLLSGLPASLPAAVAIAQHRHKDSNESLGRFLQRQCALPVVEPEDKELVLPGRVYLAPADYHLLIEVCHRQDNSPWEYAVGTPSFALSTEAPVSYARPSIDALFESAADAYGEKLIGVILTGASADGTQGLLKIKTCGGKAIVQEPTTAACSTMPKAAITSVTVDWILPLSDIAPLIVNLCHPALR